MRHWEVVLHRIFEVSEGEVEFETKNREKSGII